MPWAVRVYHALDDGSYEKDPFTVYDTIFANRENAEFFAKERMLEQSGNEFLFEVEEVNEV